MAFSQRTERMSPVICLVVGGGGLLHHSPAFLPYKHNAKAIASMTPKQREDSRRWAQKREALIVAHIAAGKTNAIIMGMSLNPPATAEEINRLRLRTL